jgi:Zn-dependent protease
MTNLFWAYWTLCLSVLLIHELGHVLPSLLLTKPRKIWGIGFSWTGFHVVLTNDIPKVELLVSLGGPLANILMIGFAPWFPLFAVLNFVFGYVNLLPIPPSDGWTAWKKWKQI